MDIEFDPYKSRINERERGLPFALASQFEFETAVFKVDARCDYGEVRIRALGKIDGRVHVVVFTEREHAIRIISLRKANRREVYLYEQEISRP
ncbi:BrnT family toxin [Castellaniella sp. WN]